MSTLMMGLIVIGCSSALALAWQKRLEEQLPLVITGIVAVLYAFGIVGRLVWGVYATAICAFLAWTFVTYRLFRSRGDGLHLLLTPGALVVGIIFLWLLLSFRVHTVHVWDDFSHWMLAVKNMVYYDAMPSAVESSTVFYRSYPPGATLFEYLWTKLSGGYNEGDPQRAMNLMMLSFLIPVMKNRNWRSWFRNLCTAGAIFVLPLAYNHVVYSSIYVDTLMGCVMLYGLYTWFSSKGDVHAYVSVGCAAFLLPLLKSSGLMLAFLTLIIIGTDSFLYKGHVHHGRKWRGIATLAAAALLSAVSWRAFLALNQVTDTMSSSNFSFTGLFNVLIGKGAEYQIITIRNFLTKMTEANIIANDSRLRPSVALVMLIYAAVVLMLTFLRSDDKAEKKRWIVALWELSAGMVCYEVALLFTYLFAFKPYEAMYLYSFVRYLSPMLIAVTGMALIALDELQHFRFRFLPSAAALMSLLLLVDTESIGNSTFRANDQGAQLQIALQEYRIADEAIQLLDAKKDKVFLIVTTEQMYEFFLNAYHIAPVRTQPATWWTSKNEMENWKDALQDGSYTHLYSLVDNFELENKALIVEPDIIQRGILYRIQYDAEGIKLSKAAE